VRVGPQQHHAAGLQVVAPRDVAVAVDEGRARRRRRDREDVQREAVDGDAPQRGFDGGICCGPDRAAASRGPRGT
jgi:hypothetical protein